MPGRSKRSRVDVIDLTADSSDLDGEQPARKNARLRTFASQPPQSTADDLVVLDEDDEENDIIDLAQEVDNNGVGFVQVGRISM